MSVGTRIDLKNVTVCAADCINPQLASRAIDISARHCDFGDAILFTHEDIPSPARIVRTPHLASREEYNDYVLKEIIHHIHTPWVLLIQWDGYVLHPEMWSDDFFQYDYIGARWPWRNDGMSVGNGGFSLRSAKLMRLLASDAFPLVDGIHEDKLIGRHYRRDLEGNHGIRFAPEAVADRFSFENHVASGKTFGFHSPQNFNRFMSDDELRIVANLAHPSTLTAGAMICLLANYLLEVRFSPVKILYPRMRALMDQTKMHETIVSLGLHADLATYLLRLCDALTSETRTVEA